MANDTDADGDTLSVDSVTQGTNGSVVNNGSDVTYTPDVDFNGSDSFSYTISDGNGGTATATVTITVNAVNDVPVALDDEAMTDEETAVTIDVLANDSDVDEDSLSLDSVTQPVSGTAVISDAMVVYTPAVDFSGSDSFTYTISDCNGGSATATVTITVTSQIGDILYLSANTNDTAGDVTYRDEDIISYDATSDTWAMVFDGSDVGIGSADINAFQMMEDGTILMSFGRPNNISGLGRVDDSDIVRFIPPR